MRVNSPSLAHICAALGLSVAVHMSISIGGVFTLIFTWLSQGDPYAGWGQGVRDLARGFAAPVTRYYAICLVIAVSSVPLVLGMIDAWLIFGKKRYGSLVILGYGIIVALTSFVFYMGASYLPSPTGRVAGGYADIAVRLVAPLMLAGWLSLIPISTLIAHAIVSIALGKAGWSSDRTR